MSITIDHGISACAGHCKAGWYGGVLILQDSGEPCRDTLPSTSWQSRTDHARRWIATSANPQRRLQLLQSIHGEESARDIAVAERIEGPACPREPVEEPVLVWIERRADQWHFRQYRGDQATTITSRNAVMRCPGIAATPHGMVVCFETDTGPATTAVELVDASGRTIYRTAGRVPQLRAVRDGFLLAFEDADRNRVTLRLAHFHADHPAAPRQTAGISAGDYLFNADIAWWNAGQAVVIAAESSHSFGADNQIGLHRTIPVWRWDLQTDVEPMGRLPVEQRAFKSLGAENMTPIKPRVIVDDGRPTIVFKQHRYSGKKTFGWDLLRCRRTDDTWSPPERISPEVTASDTSFGLLARNGRFVGLFPAHVNTDGPSVSRNHRVEVVSFDRHTALPAIDVPEELRADYRIPKSCRDIAPPPPPLPNCHEGRQLIWGDIHIHSTYSKCVSAVDGDPRENIRYAREVLGCRVFALAEHTPKTTGPESTWLYDQLESTAGADNVVLYASEPGFAGMRHTNWYCRDRRTFEALERIFIAHMPDYHAALRQVREDLPPDSVLVLRHFHGQAIPNARIHQHVDPHFEVAMEAMQGRGNAMFEANENAGGLFPNQFLDAGCKIGLVGGTDHFREWAPNHFCLTGFWVKEVSADGVWEALRNRCTIAMSNARVALSATCNGLPMGSEVTIAPDQALRVSVHASCARTVRRATLIRDGKPLDWHPVDADTAAIDLVDPGLTPGPHWVVPTVEVETAYDDGRHGICHASPFFIWKD